MEISAWLELKLASEPLFTTIGLLSDFARHHDDAALSESKAVRSSNILVEVRAANSVSALPCAKEPKTYRIKLLRSFAMPEIGEP